MKKTSPNSQLPTPKIAIVCDWLVGIGGAERVVLETHRMFPDAPIYTSQYDEKNLKWFKNADVRTGWLQTFPKAFKKFMPVLRAWYFSHLDLSDYDVIITINFGAESKAVKFRSDAVHICYCNAPTHYYWSRYADYMKNPGFGALNWLARIGLRLLVEPMRRWDYRAAQKPTHMIGNSSHIVREIKKYYDRESVAIFPPVNVDRFTPTKKTRNGFVVAGRQTPYKKIDLAVAACTKLNLPLTVLGDGPDHTKLVAMAGSTITFDTAPNDEKVAEYFEKAEGFIFPNLDDFGITPVEAMAAGTPVIAFRGGGALDYVMPGETGEFFEEQTIESLSDVLRVFDPKKYDHAVIRKKSEAFSAKVFRDSLMNYIEKAAGGMHG